MSAGATRIQIKKNYLSPRASKFRFFLCKKVNGFVKGPLYISKRVILCQINKCMVAAEFIFLFD
jgi:hypothetical protein